MSAILIGFFVLFAKFAYINKSSLLIQWIYKQSYRIYVICGWLGDDQNKFWFMENQNTIIIQCHGKECWILRKN